MSSAVLTAGLLVSTARAKVTHRECLIRGPGAEALCCDLDGDGLQDIVLRGEPNVLVFYQDPEKGFSEKPNQVCRLERRPSILWPAQLGPRAQSLLVMTSAGVTELDFSNRGGPPVRRQIITQRTILPESSPGPALAYVPLSPRTKGQAPVILVPAGRDLQVWRRTDTWRCAQTLKDALETTIAAARDDLGYDRMARLTLSLGDVTSDQRDDILVRASHIPTSRYAVYAQSPDGQFSADPTFTWTGPWDWSWYCWVDVNRDGRVDLIKNTWLQEPWFIPGMLSSKVLVRIYTADEQGRIPTEPQQVFRKGDWVDSIPIVDVDGDGYLDLVLGYSPFDSREGFRKALSAKQIDFTLRLHFYRPGSAPAQHPSRGTDDRFALVEPGAGFPEKPDCEAKLLIHLDHRSMDLTSPRHRYFETFVNLQGDFNGDGRKDLLVRDRADRISVYPFVSRQTGFAKNAALWFNYTDPIDHMQVADLNNDHISDLILKVSKKEMFRVFLSHEP